MPTVRPNARRTSTIVTWEAVKAAERAAKGKDGRPAGTLDDVPLALPALDARRESFKSGFFDRRLRLE